MPAIRTNRERSERLSPVGADGCFTTFLQGFPLEALVEGETAPGTPTWVKVLGVLFLAVLLVFLVLHLTGAAPVRH